MARISRLVWLENDLLTMVELLLYRYIAEAEIGVGRRLNGRLRDVGFRLMIVLQPRREAFLIFRRRECKLVDRLDLKETCCADFFRQQIIFEHLKSKKNIA